MLKPDYSLKLELIKIKNQLPLYNGPQPPSHSSIHLITKNIYNKLNHK